MDAIIHDLRYAFRSLARSPGFTTVAVLTLAVAVGANTAILSIADAVLFRPLPYSDPERVYVLLMRQPSTGRRFTMVPHEHIQAIDGRHGGLSEVGLIVDGPRVVVTTADGAESVPTLAVSANYFDVLGVRPARGRLFDARDAAEPGRSAVLSHSAWQQRFGGDDQIIGRSVKVGSSSFDVVGVLPPKFFFPVNVHATAPEIVTVTPTVPRGAKGGVFYPAVRLEPGITRERAQTELDALMAPLAARGVSNLAATPVLDEVRASIFPSGQPIMWFLLAGAMFLLLLACANLANLLLARSQRREQETAVRAALGASTARLVRPIVLEALIVGLAAAALALLVTNSTFEALARQVPRMVYRNVPIGVDLRIVGFSVGLSLLGGLIFSVIPAWRSAALDVRARIQGVNRSGSLRHRRFGRPMVAVQVALAIVLVFGAVITTRAFVSVLRVPLGFAPENVIAIHVTPRRGTSQRDFYARAIETLVRRSDVISAGAGGSIPLYGAAPDEPAFKAGSRNRIAGIVQVLPGYFETLGIRLARGRLPNWTDVRTGVDVAVVAESTARLLFPGRDPLGETFDNSSGRRFIVIGVVSDFRQSLEPQQIPFVYVLGNTAAPLYTIVVRTRDRQDVLLKEIRREVAALVPGVLTATWWSESIEGLAAYRNPRFQTIVLGTFAAFALGLTGLGVFGVVSFLVAMRTKEMAIRMAMGATPESLITFVLRQAFTPIAVGIMMGLLATHWARGLAEVQLFKVETRDPAMLVAAVLTVVLATLAAAYLPARRAGRVDPVQALRAE